MRVVSEVKIGIDDVLDHAVSSQTLLATVARQWPGIEYILNNMYTTCVVQI